jgi:hypothetical protein
MFPVDIADTGGARAPSRARTLVLPVSLALFVVSLLLLRAGNFLQLDAEPGAARSGWDLPLGYLALLTAVAAIAVSVFDRRARQLLGGALLLLDAVIFFWTGADDGFRFVWSDNEGEGLLLQVVLVLVGLALMTPSFRTPVDDDEVPGSPGGEPPRGAVTGWARTVIYLALVLVVPSVALYAGIIHFDSTQCADEDGACDLGFLEGVFWATIALVLVVVGIVATEVRMRVRRWRSSRAAAG